MKYRECLNIKFKEENVELNGSISFEKQCEKTNWIDGSVVKFIIKHNNY